MFVFEKGYYVPRGRVMVVNKIMHYAPQWGWWTYRKGRGLLRLWKWILFARMTKNSINNNKSQLRWFNDFPMFYLFSGTDLLFWQPIQPRLNGYERHKTLSRIDPFVCAPESTDSRDTDGWMDGMGWWPRAGFCCSSLSLCRSLLSPLERNS